MSYSPNRENTVFEIYFPHNQIFTYERNEVSRFQCEFFFLTVAPNFCIIQWLR